MRLILLNLYSIYVAVGPLSTPQKKKKKINQIVIRLYTESEQRALT